MCVNPIDVLINAVVDPIDCGLCVNPDVARLLIRCHMIATLMSQYVKLLLLL